MTRTTRYQGAIVRDHHLLLIRHREHATGRTYWVIPGGGIEAGETAEQCVCREMQEETGLTVQVERLLLDEPSRWNGHYQFYQTYLCTAYNGEAAPGHEPEEEASQVYHITAVRWFDLRDPASWGHEVLDDPRARRIIEAVRAALGYAGGLASQADI